MLTWFHHVRKPIENPYPRGTGEIFLSTGIPILTRRISLITVTLLYTTAAHAIPSAQAKAPSTLRLCLNAKTDAIIPGINCKSGESLFTSQTYLK